MTRLLGFMFLLALALISTGCGAKCVPVEGVVNFDGHPVEGATVTFITADGKQSASGLTDASGHFSLSTANQPGALPGEYKIVVVKSPAVAGNEKMTADSAEYMKHMKKEAAEQGVGKNPTTVGDMMKAKMAGGKGVPPTAGGTPKPKS